MVTWLSKAGAWLFEILWPPARLARIQAELDRREREAVRTMYPIIYLFACRRRLREAGWSEAAIDQWSEHERMRLAEQGIYPPTSGQDSRGSIRRSA